MNCGAASPWQRRWTPRTGSVWRRPSGCSPPAQSSHCLCTAMREAHNHPALLHWGAFASIPYLRTLRHIPATFTMHSGANEDHHQDFFLPSNKCDCLASVQYGRGHKRVTQPWKFMLGAGQSMCRAWVAAACTSALACCVKIWHVCGIYDSSRARLLHQWKLWHSVFSPLFSPHLFNRSQNVCSRPGI